MRRIHANSPRALGQIYWLTLIVALGIDVVLLMRLLKSPWDFFNLVRITYTYNTIVLPIALLVIFGSGLFLLRRVGGDYQRLRRITYFGLSMAFLLFAARLWASHIEPSLLQIRRVSIQSPKIKKPLRILHMSDIQSDRVGNYEKKVFEKGRALNPDLVIFTGDMIQSIPPQNYLRDIRAIAQLWEEFQPPLGIVGVFGDVDGPHETGPAIPSIHWLHGQETTLEADGTRLHTFGLTLHQSHNYAQETRSVIAQWIQTCSTATFSQDFTLLIGHAPDFALAARDYPIDLCLAGHTHGGQVRIPFYGPLVLLSDVPRDWGRGFRTIGQSRLNVSAGIGGEHIVGLPTIRLNCPPEMTLITLVPRPE